MGSRWQVWHNVTGGTADLPPTYKTVLNNSGFFIRYGDSLVPIEDYFKERVYWDPESSHWLLISDGEHASALSMACAERKQCNVGIPLLGSDSALTVQPLCLRG